MLGVFVPCILILLEAGRTSTQNVLAFCVGASTYCLMTLNLSLVTRPRVVVSLAGGLDRFSAHKHSQAMLWEFAVEAAKKASKDNSDSATNFVTFNFRP